MKSIQILKDSATTGHRNPDRLFALLRSWGNSSPVSIANLVEAMNFRSPAPLNCCLNVLERQGLIQIS